nr:MAG TPA: hypothetical protein [Caudoviricetes sp.]
MATAAICCRRNSAFILITRFRLCFYRTVSS